MSSCNQPPIASEKLASDDSGDFDAGVPREIFQDFNLDEESVASARASRRRSRAVPHGHDVLASLLQVGQWLGSDEAAAEFNERTRRLPRVGQKVLGFRLIRELGRGAFARVFLAEQMTLADRRVAVKISRAPRDESQTLAQLQHTHIVPIYSAHADPESGLRVIAMPYFGGTTLDRLMDKAGLRAQRHATGRSLVTALDDLSLNDSSLDRDASAGSMNSQNWSSAEASRSPSVAASQPASPWLASRLLGRAFLGSWREADTTRNSIGQPARSVLQRSSYMQAVTWIAARLAEGLSHAHQRGILHRDVKPSNVLVACDGQPMLLDFNLARDLKSNDAGAVAYVGGTLPFMAPEHLDAFNVENTTPPSAVDTRSDIYSLGVVIFEMLTSKHPFRSERPGESLPKMLDEMAAERRRGAPSPRATNPTVPRSLDAIVRRCLEPDPARRYPDAANLAEDLGRELENLPLRHTREPSLRERARKWMRRHPRLSSGGSIALASSALVVGLSSLVLVVAGRIAGYDAERRWIRFQQGLVRAQLLVHTGHEPGQNLDDGERVCRDTLALFDVDKDDFWLERSRAARLSSRQRVDLTGAATELLILLARVKAEQGRLAQSPESRTTLVCEAIDLLTRAERSAGDRVPRALYEDRSEYRRRLNDAAGADADSLRGDATPLRTARDHYLRATSLAAEKRHEEAIASLDAALRLDPKHFWSHFTLGICLDQLGRYAESVRAYGAAIALWPDFSWTYLNRGLASSRLGHWTAAIDDYTMASRLDDDCLDARVNLGVAYLKIHRYADAERELSIAIDRGRCKAGVWAARGAARAGLGDIPGARRDFDAALSENPGDAAVLMSRGFALARHDPRLALADFERVLDRQPELAQSHYGRAAALSMLRDQNDAAIESASRALEFDPSHVEARCTLAVLLARAGRFDDAIREAESTLSASRASHILYSVACVYSLASDAETRFVDRAFELLEQALRHGAGRDRLARDPDLAALRKDARFARLGAGTD